MLRINHAVLHGFELEIGECDISQREIDLEVKQTKSYVTRSVRRILANAESKHGQFAESSSFKDELVHYFAGQREFLDVSADIALSFYDVLHKSEDLDACDLLVVDFVDTGDMKIKQQVSNDIDSLVVPKTEDAYDSEGSRGFALLLLPRRQAFIHDVRNMEGQAYNDIVRHDSTLPNPSQKIDTYAVVKGSNLDIDFHDVERVVMGKKSYIIPEVLLKCSSIASSKEVVTTVTKLVEDVAQEYGLEPAVAAAKAKSYVIEQASAARDVTPAEVGQAVFAQSSPDAAQRYEHEATTELLPERVSVAKSTAKRLAKNHRIRTDTGIEISFPSEYAGSSEFISFERGDDGKIFIEIKNIGSIENR
ncbi:nucleoid-associated protein [Atopobium fossor]|uniref:nucleoid-associated protein n=1 Tax=Atopobium fossor TaxID=39487 RepID=UPI00040AA613|nr:nucleoid-associated protein [Atopobium fossor]